MIILDKFILLERGKTWDKIRTKVDLETFSLIFHNKVWDQLTFPIYKNFI